MKGEEVAFGIGQVDLQAVLNQYHKDIVRVRRKIKLYVQIKKRLEILEDVEKMVFEHLKLKSERDAGRIARYVAFEQEDSRDQALLKRKLASRNLLLGAIFHNKSEILLTLEETRIKTRSKIIRQISELSSLRIALSDLKSSQTKMQKELQDKMTHSLEVQRKNTSQIKKDIDRMSRPIRRAVEKQISMQYDHEIKAVEQYAARIIASSRQQLELQAERMIDMFEKQFVNDVRLARNSAKTTF
jgi:hypothetical protein|eukprot:g4239.t1